MKSLSEAEQETAARIRSLEHLSPTAIPDPKIILDVLSVLKGVNELIRDLRGPQDNARDASNTQRAVAGALYDFLGRLTSLKPAIMMGATVEVTPALDELVKWAEERGLDLTHADVNGWMRRL